MVGERSRLVLLILFTIFLEIQGALCDAGCQHQGSFATLEENAFAFRDLAARCAEGLWLSGRGTSLFSGLRLNLPARHSLAGGVALGSQGKAEPFRTSGGKPADHLLNDPRISLLTELSL
jgi:hypothetical protein